MQQQMDGQRVREFAGQLMGLYTGGMLSFMVDIGYKTGLFDAAAKGPGSSQEIAERAGLNERYVREWLGALTTGGIFDYDPASRRSRRHLRPCGHACPGGRPSDSWTPD